MAAHIFLSDADGCWGIRKLDGEQVALGMGAVIIGEVGLEAGHVLLASPGSGVRVNGLPLSTGARKLVHKDEVWLPGSGSIYYSTEVMPEITAFPGAARTMCCPRCKLPLEEGQPAVRCPGERCGVWHHQTAERPCWLYSDRCALCGESTDLERSYRFVPEEP